MSTEGPTMLFAFPLTPYWRWFAWRPVRTWDHRWRWLCWVERRLMQMKPHLQGRIGGPWFQYRVVNSRTLASTERGVSEPTPKESSNGE